MGFPETIQADAVVLRRWRRDYAEVAAAAVQASLPELKPFMPWASEEYDVETAGKFADISDEGWTSGAQRNYAIFDRSGVLVGSCGLHDRVGPGALEIGYWLHSDHTGRGYATMAAIALTQAALAQPGIERLVLKHDVANTASGAVAARAGYHEVGRNEREIAAPGERGIDIIWEYP